jgi:hypothetical protein
MVMQTGELRRAARAEARPRSTLPQPMRISWPAYATGVLLLALLVRLPLLARDSGVYDAAYFRALMKAAVTDLPIVYTQVSPDYPPLTVLTFGLTGTLTTLCCAPDLPPKDTATIVAAKLPEVVASLALAATIGWSIVRRSRAPALAGKGRLAELAEPPRLAEPPTTDVASAPAPWTTLPSPASVHAERMGGSGLAVRLAGLSWLAGLATGLNGLTGLAGLATAAYALNPGVVYVSAFWTQAEALWVLPIVLGLLAVERGRFVLAWLAFAAGVLTKPQAAAFLPLLLLATWRQAPPSSWLTGPLAALGLALASAVPWWLTGHAGDVVQVYLGLPGADAWVSGSAYNLWYLWLLGGTHQVPADMPLVGDLTYQHAGWLLFGLLLGWVLWHAGKRRAAPSLYLSAATLWLGLAVLLTQTHERYFHPVLPLLLLAPELYAARSRLWLVWTAVTLAYAYNLITVLPFDGFPGPSLIAETAGGLRVLVLRGLSLVAAGTFVASLIVLAASLRRPGDPRDEPAWLLAR